LYPRINLRAALTGQATGKECSVIGFKGAQAGVKEFALGDDHDVKPWCDLVATENLSNQSFRSVSLDRATQLLRGGDTQPPDAASICQEEHGAIPAVDAKATAIDVLKFRSAANPFGWSKSQSYSLLTVRRFRPLARRRFSTNRPFFVAIRTKNPCVRLRWRVLG
jgi:hypothetical protein